MRAVSAAIVLLAGAMLVLASTVPTLMQPYLAICGGGVCFVGLWFWLAAFLEEKRRPGGVLPTDNR